MRASRSILRALKGAVTIFMIMSLAHPGHELGMIEEILSSMKRLAYQSPELGFWTLR